MDFGAQSYDLMWEAMTGALIASYTAVSPFFQFTARGLSLFAILVSPVLSLSHWFSIHFDQLVPYHRLCSLVRCIHSFTTPSRSLLSSHFSLVGAALNARASTSLMFLVLCCVFIFRTFSAYIETSVSLLCFFFRVSLSLSLSADLSVASYSCDSFFVFLLILLSSHVHLVCVWLCEPACIYRVFLPLCFFNQITLFFHSRLLYGIDLILFTCLQNLLLQFLGYVLFLFSLSLVFSRP